MEESSYRAFMRHIHNKNSKKRKPIRAVMELTYACNHKCVHCYSVQQPGRKELSKRELFSIIDQLLEAGTVEITFTGGEVFTRPDIMDIIFYARKKCFMVSLITNGTLITEKIASRLIRWGINGFEISFLGSTRKTFESITQSKGSFDKTLSAVKMLKRKGVRPHIKTCVTKINLNELGKIGELASGLGLPFSFSPVLIPRVNMDKAPTRLSIRPEEFLGLRENFRKRLKAKGKASMPMPADPCKAVGAEPVKYNKVVGSGVKDTGFWKRRCLFDCVAGQTTAFIDPYGRMKACTALPEPDYDIKRHGVRDCWLRIKRFVDGLIPPKDWGCYTCEYHNFCPWCPGVAYLNTGAIFGCSGYLKEGARARKQEFERREASRLS